MILPICFCAVSGLLWYLWAYGMFYSLKTGPVEGLEPFGVEGPEPSRGHHPGFGNRVALGAGRKARPNFPMPEFATNTIVLERIIRRDDIVHEERQ